MKTNCEIILKVIEGSDRLDTDETKELDINYFNLNLKQTLDDKIEDYRELGELCSTLIQPKSINKRRDNI